MTDVKISIIMPVYGVENYVGKAIESILSQTYTNWEFFCINDGTKDRSGEICDEYAKKDSRIKVIHKENGGAPSARNIAIDKVQGKYIYFMDSDDWAEPTMLEDMVKIAEANNSQLVVAGYYIDTYYSDTEKFVQEQIVSDRVYSTQLEFRKDAHNLFDQNLLYTPWNKLYCAEYIIDNKLYFPQTFWDDFPFNLSVIRDIERVAVTSNKYYHFIRKRSESETAKYRSDMYNKREDERKWMEELYEYWDVNSPEIQEFLARRYVERIVGCIENITNSDCDLSFIEKRKEIKRIISSPSVIEAIKVAQPNSKHMKIMLKPIKWGNVSITHIEGCIISKVKTKNTKLFAVLKANR